jgi:hypothetical protein
MSDGWTNTRQCHLINFLANSPTGTYFLGSVDASSEVASANMLTYLLDKQINRIGKEHVMQVVTDNGAISYGKDPPFVLDTLCCPLLGFAVGRHWKDQGIQ